MHAGLEAASDACSCPYRACRRTSDGASEELRRARQRCRTLEGRLRGILKSHGGEVAEQALLCCHARYLHSLWGPTALVSYV